MIRHVVIVLYFAIVLITVPYASLALLDRLYPNRWPGWWRVIAIALPVGAFFVAIGVMAW